MQPNVQLALMNEDLPAPSALLLEVLPEPAVAAALGLLSRLIALAAGPVPSAPAGQGGSDD
jgi:hypothetical protein